MVPSNDSRAAISASPGSAFATIKKSLSPAITRGVVAFARTRLLGRLVPRSTRYLSRKLNHTESAESPLALPDHTNTSFPALLAYAMSGSFAPPSGILLIGTSAAVVGWNVGENTPALTVASLIQVIANRSSADAIAKYLGASADCTTVTAGVKLGSVLAWTELSALIIAVYAATPALVYAIERGWLTLPESEVGPLPRDVSCEACGSITSGIIVVPFEVPAPTGTARSMLLPDENAPICPVALVAMPSIPGASVGVCEASSASATGS